MSAFFGRARVRRLPPLWALLSLVAAVLVGARQSQVNSAAPEIRPVRGITVERREAGTRVTLTGRIDAEDEATLGFRIAGRVLQNDRKLGDQVQAPKSWRASSRKTSSTRCDRRRRHWRPPAANWFKLASISSGWTR
jgi:hypothetical protein